MKLKKFKNLFQSKNNHSFSMSTHAHTHNKINAFFWIKNFILIFLALYFVFISISQPSGDIKWTWHYGIWFPITTYVVFWEGRGYFKIYKKLIKGIMDMDTLIGLAVHIIYLYSFIIMLMNLQSNMYKYEAMWEAPIVLIIATNIGHTIEEKLSKSATETYEKLKKLKNSKVNFVTNNKIRKVHAKDLSLGAVILVKKGDIVPLDGKIITGKSVFDYSNITGESKKILKIKDEEVISGSFNLGDAIKLRVTKIYKNSTIGLIVNKIENASMTKPKIQKVADNILKWFIPLVISVAFTTLIIWLILGYMLPNGIDLPWTFKKHSIMNTAIRAGVTVLAIACPCVLGIATPLITTITSTLSMKAGLLINKIDSLESINKIKYFVFDKTGTITTNHLVVSKIHGDKKLIGIAKALENEIKHPIANAINSLEGDISRQVSQIKSTKNKGIKGLYQKQVVSIEGFNTNDKKVDKNNTLIALYVNGNPKLIFELKNNIRKNVIKTIQIIKSYGYIPVMITGDNKHIAKYIASEIGIEKIYYEINSIGKSEIIKKLQNIGGVVFVGDGFNDSIGMKQADLSLAFATGSDITNSLADISIVNNDFIAISNLIKIAKMNKNRIRISMTWALLFNIITIPIAIILLVPIWAGATIMASSNIFIMINALLYKIQGTKKIT